ncbi:hypothetical protein GPEL0_01f2394 [Geoanaerobacter pelophilus]|uniref:Uncharacterized protein n=1 Tax=Geoanaerobacter pelophilus TaxID=60036 RepID=A0ABQ0MIL8_9BACT|nr:hypothetical protein GPEL0_01f2394 [Geoanaerobacter pelophilus]
MHLQVTNQPPQLTRWCLRTTRPAGRTTQKHLSCDKTGAFLLAGAP